MIKFVNYNKHTNIKNWSKEQLLLIHHLNFFLNHNLELMLHRMMHITNFKVNFFFFKIFSTTKCHIQIQRKQIIQFIQN
jgi:hypothetical protein